MKARLPILAVLLSAPLALTACQTSDDSQWLAAGAGVPYDRAEETCREQQEFIADESARPAFFVKCMGALGWAPEPGSEWAGVAEANPAS